MILFDIGMIIVSVCAFAGFVVFLQFLLQNKTSDQDNSFTWFKRLLFCAVIGLLLMLLGGNP